MRKSMILAAASALALATAALPAAAAGPRAQGNPAPLDQGAVTPPNMDQPGPPGAGPESTQQERFEHESMGTTQRRVTTGQSGVMPQEGGPAFPPDIVGKNLRNTQGEVVGSIEAVRGNQIVVSVGSYLGMGRHEIVLNHDEVNMAGEDRITTPLSITQLQAKPAISVESTAPGGRSGDRFEPR